MSENVKLPPELLPFSKKNKIWRKLHLDWADSKTFFNYGLVRKSVIHKKINYDLLNGKLHMSDLELILNPDNIQASFIPDKILHYTIINSKLNVLRGEESKRINDYRVIVTNPNSISSIEKTKQAEIFQRLQETVSNTALSEDDYNKKLEEINNYYNYEWLDIREIRANALLNHYMKEYNIPFIFNNGIMDAMTVGEEIYQVDIIGGEPTIEKLNPLKIRIFKSGYSNKIEDADIVIIEDYWSPGKVIDTYYDVLTEKDVEYIENAPTNIGLATSDSMNNIDERMGFINNQMISDEMSTNGFYFDPYNLFSDGTVNSLLPFDIAGNLRVMRMYWKSRRKIKKVKSYNLETGEEVFHFYPETYVINDALGEEETSLWINEAWEGVKIGTDIYLNMRPRLVLYNRLSNPSRCHFGIVGSIYNLNDSKPFSLVDMGKPYNYLYDVIHDRLNKAIANNWGTIMELDLSLVPKGWDIDKWMYYAKVNKLAIKDSFKEGNIGQATGKLAGNFANNSRGLLNTNDGNYIQLLMNLLEFIKMEMSEVMGISKLREGLISNRETVGGVERATLQSTHITEWLFTVHEDVKRRALEAFLETAKIALRGRTKKFQYILSDMSLQLMEIDGDEFAENDYGLAVDNSEGTLALNLKLDTLALAALLNSTLSFSSIMKLYTSTSLAEKQRIVEKDEKARQDAAAQEAQLKELTIQQAQLLEIQFKLDELLQKELANIRDNETKLMIATLKSNELDGIQEEDEVDATKKSELLEKIRLFDERLSFDKKKHEDDVILKNKLINKNNKINK